MDILISLRQVGVEIIFPGEARAFLDVQVQCKRGAHAEFHGAAI